MPPPHEKRSFRLSVQYRFRPRAEHIFTAVFVPLLVMGLVLGALGGCGGGYGLGPVHTGTRPALPPATAPPPPVSVPRVQPPSADTAKLATLQVRLRYAAEQGALHLHAAQPLTLRAGDQTLTVPAGDVQLRAEQVQPAQTRVHVFPKTFEPEQARELEEYLQFWRERGYAPRVEVFGKRLITNTGRHVDNRLLWVSVAQVPTQAEAAQVVRRISETEQVWAWTREEEIAQGRAQIHVSAGGRTYPPLPAPITLESSAPVAMRGIDSGFWREARGDSLAPTPLQLQINAEGKLALYGNQPVEHYLRGVLPAEMPASWPAHALEAQAVAARSEVLANLAGKHRLEGFDFCALEHCRAYRGLAGHMPSTDAALVKTAGEVLVNRGRVVPTVFSSNCGGWTENNESVWSGPPNGALRAAGDFPGDARPAQIGNISQWLNSRPPAFCAEDATGFRWVRRHSAAELSAMVNKYHRVGTVRSIELGPRGAGGRLQSVRVIGSQGTQTIERELNIRLAFGSLPSAVFTVESGGGQFTFRGAGRGHGVGMCQHGARGMAARGYGHEAILHQYFAGVAIERLD